MADAELEKHHSYKQAQKQAPEIGVGVAGKFKKNMRQEVGYLAHDWEMGLLLHHIVEQTYDFVDWGVFAHYLLFAVDDIEGRGVADIVEITGIGGEAYYPI